MNIYIQQQQLQVGEIEIIAVSSSSSFQVGDNDQVILYAVAEDVPDSIQIGPFPPMTGYYNNSTANIGENNVPFTMGLDQARPSKNKAESL